MEGGPISELTIHWPDELNEHGWPMLWFGSWLTGEDGWESGWFYRGRGNLSEGYPIPADASGFRIRKWPSEGIDPEYADVSFNGVSEFWAEKLDFDVEKEHSRLPQRFDRTSEFRDPREGDAN